jgi:hypothetical protein
LDDRIEWPRVAVCIVGDVHKPVVSSFDWLRNLDLRRKASDEVRVNASILIELDRGITADDNHLLILAKQKLSNSVSEIGRRKTAVDMPIGIKSDQRV